MIDEFTLQVLLTLAVFLTTTCIVYTFVGWGKIWKNIKLYSNRAYWVNYNVIEACAWYAKGMVILPALLYGKEIWQLHFLTLFTSSLLIWASRKKGLPTLVIFNTIWIGISSIVIVRNIL
jgi:hypothetical protein